MANQLADDAKKAEAAAAPPTDAQLRAELEAERKARQDAEQKAGYFQGAASAEWRRAEAATRSASAARTATPDPVDPFAKIAAEDAMLDPERKARLLDEGSRSRAREEAIRVGTEVDARAAQRMNEMESRLALRMFQSQNPEIAQDEEGFAAAMMRAKIRADQKHMGLDAMGMLELGRQIYNEGKATAPPVPYTESPSGGAAAPGGRQVKKEEPEPSMAEKVYGAQDFIDEDKIPVSDYTEKWLDNRNLELVDKEKLWSAIRNVRGDLEAAKQRRRASGR